MKPYIDSFKFVEKDIKKQLLNIRKYIEKNCKNVGGNFAREARNIHYEKNKKKKYFSFLILK